MSNQSMKIVNQLLKSIKDGKTNRFRIALAISQAQQPPVDLNQLHQNGHTFLTFAVLFYNPRIVTQLMSELSVNFNQVNAFNRTPRQVADECGIKVKEFGPPPKKLFIVSDENLLSDDEFYQLDWSSASALKTSVLSLRPHLVLDRVRVQLREQYTEIAVAVVVKILPNSMRCPVDDCRAPMKFVIDAVGCKTGHKWLCSLCNKTSVVDRHTLTGFFKNGPIDTIAVFYSFCKYPFHEGFVREFQITKDRRRKWRREFGAFFERNLMQNVTPFTKNVEMSITEFRQSAGNFYLLCMIQVKPRKMYVKTLEEDDRTCESIAEIITKMTAKDHKIVISNKSQKYVTDKKNLIDHLNHEKADNKRGATVGNTPENDEFIEEVKYILTPRHRKLEATERIMISAASWIADNNASIMLRNLCEMVGVEGVRADIYRVDNVSKRVIE